MLEPADDFYPKSASVDNEARVKPRARFWFFEPSSISKPWNLLWILRLVYLMKHTYILTYSIHHGLSISEMYLSNGRILLQSRGWLWWLYHCSSGRVYVWWNVLLLPAPVRITINLHTLDLLPRLFLLHRANSELLISFAYFFPWQLLLVSLSSFTKPPSLAELDLTCPSSVKLIINSGFPNGNRSPRSTCQKWYVFPYNPTISFISAVSATSQTALGMCGLGIIRRPDFTCFVSKSCKATQR